MPSATFHTWQRVGGVHRRADELERRRQLRAYHRTWPDPRSP